VPSAFLGGMVMIEREAVDGLESVCSEMENKARLVLSRMEAGESRSSRAFAEPKEGAGNGSDQGRARGGNGACLYIGRGEGRNQ